MDDQDGPRRAQLTLADEGSGAFGGNGAGLVVRLSGELDLATVAELAAPLKDLLAREPQPLILELGELQFMDSSGVAVLIRLANHFQRLETRGARPAVRRVIEVLGLAGRVGLPKD
jgi:anti-sigma B factor antagonist